MSAVRKNIPGLKKKKSSSVNPFIKAIEDKKKINEAIKNGRKLSSLKGIKFAKPI